jgi:hypothetical protein
MRIREGSQGLRKRGKNAGQWLSSACADSDLLAPTGALAGAPEVPRPQAVPADPCEAGCRYPTKLVLTGEERHPGNSVASDRGWADTAWRYCPAGLAAPGSSRF